MVGSAPLMRGRGCDSSVYIQREVWDKGAIAPQELVCVSQ
jgi:hypothetical protein